MEKHERHCTMNPGRTCRWAQLEYGPRTRYGEHTARKGLPRWLRLSAPLTKTHLDKLHDYVGGCPACMLAALRQSGVEYHYNYDTGEHLFDYKVEIARYREHEQEIQEQEEMWEIERSWL